MNGTVGDRIRECRRALGLTQRDLASPGVCAQYISKVERGQRTPSMKALRKIAPILRVSTDYLETGKTQDRCDRYEEALRRIASPRSGHLSRDALREIAWEALR